MAACVHRSLDADRGWSSMWLADHGDSCPEVMAPEWGRGEHA